LKKLTKTKEPLYKNHICRLNIYLLLLEKAWPLTTLVIFKAIFIWSLKTLKNVHENGQERSMVRISNHWCPLGAHHYVSNLETWAPMTNTLERIVKIAHGMLTFTCQKRKINFTVFLSFLKRERERTMNVPWTWFCKRFRPFVL
jgi:hypothetical protein